MLEEDSEFVVEVIMGSGVGVIGFPVDWTGRLIEVLLARHVEGNWLLYKVVAAVGPAANVRESISLTAWA